MKSKIIFLAIFFFTAFSFNTIAQDGAIDLTFNSTDLGFGNGDGAHGTVHKVAIQGDGKIIIGGSFGSYNGIGRNCIARLNIDGSLDPTFNPGLGVSGSISVLGPAIYATAIQSDGKIIIGGDFWFYSGLTYHYIARLNIDGSLDVTFNPGALVNSYVSAIAIQSDGKIVIGGGYTSYSGTSCSNIIRLNTNGSLDATFNPGAGVNGNVSAIAIQSDGKIIIGGGFASYNGINSSKIARLNTDGSLDTSFNPGTGANGSVSAITIQSDGKIIIGGDFTSYNGTSRSMIARLNTNGSLDTTFNPGSGASHGILVIDIQSDGKIIIGGNFTSYNGTAINNIARLNSNGSLDVTFNPGNEVINGVYTTATQSDGKIIAGGFFQFVNGAGHSGVTRLNSNGVFDTLFNPGTGLNSWMRTTTIQSDGKIIIGGYFTYYNGIAINNLARLNADGSIDATFNTGTGANGNVSAIAIQNDGKIIIVGYFTSYNGTSRNYIARLNTDGSIDTTFNPGTGANGYILTTVIQSDGKIIIGGSFTSYDGSSRYHIARLNADGSLDPTFLGNGANDKIFATAIQSDGKIIIVGAFTSYNGTSRNMVARLNTDGSLDATFNLGTGANTWVYTTTIQSDGKIIIGGDFTSYNGTICSYFARLNTDGSLDTAFIQGNGANHRVSTITLQSDGKIIIGGYFTTFNGTICNHIARLNIDGSLDGTFNSGTGANDNIVTTALQGDGKIIIGGYFTSYNGTGRNRVARIINSFTNEISSINQKEIFIYPNPVSNELNIEIEGNNKQVKFEILNSNGQVVFKGNIVEKTTVQTKNFTPGVYIIKLENDKNFEIKKIIKE